MEEIINSSGPTTAPLYVIFPMGISIFSLNLLALVALLRCTKMCKQIKLLALNLCISDLGTGITILYVFTIRLFSYLKVSCFVHSVPLIASSIFIMVSIITVAGMSLDRFLSIHIALRYVLVVQTKRLKILCFIFWILILTINIASYIHFGYKCDSNYMQGQNGRLIYIFLLCGLVVFISYFGVIYHLVLNKNKATSKTLSLKLFKPIFKVSVIVLAFIFLYTPFLVYIAIENFVPGQASKYQKLYVISNNLVALNSLLNPILYVWRFRECRMKIMTLICICWKDKVNEWNKKIQMTYVSFLEPTTVSTSPSPPINSNLNYV